MRNPAPLMDFDGRASAVPTHGITSPPMAAESSRPHDAGAVGPGIRERRARRPVSSAAPARPRSSILA